MDKGANSYRRFLDGDNSGFVEIVRDYKDGLILYINSIVGNISAAEDIAEDTFLKLMIKRPKDKGIGSFKTWLFTIGRNTALNYLRHEKRHADISDEEMAELKSDEVSLEQSYIAEERKLILHRAMSRLKPEYKQVLWLIYFEDFSCKDAAAVMKKTVHATETLVYRARQALKTELYKDGFTYENI